jgi:ketosteroid isomerase-like protein
MKKSALLLLILLATACASAPAATPAASEASVREAMNGFMAALNALDTDRMATFFADDVTAFVPLAQAERVESKPALVEIFRKYVEKTRQTTSSTQLVPEDVKVETSGDLALVSFNIRSEGSVLCRTFIFRRQGGRWLIVHFHASNFNKPS